MALNRRMLDDHYAAGVDVVAGLIFPLAVALVVVVITFMITVGRPS